MFTMAMVCQGKKAEVIYAQNKMEKIIKESDNAC